MITVALLLVLLALVLAVMDRVKYAVILLCVVHLLGALPLR